MDIVDDDCWYGYHTFGHNDTLKQHFLNAVNDAIIKYISIIIKWCNCFEATDLMFKTLVDENFRCREKTGRKLITLAIANYLFLRDGYLIFSSA